MAKLHRPRGPHGGSRGGPHYSDRSKRRCHALRNRTTSHFGPPAGRPAIEHLPNQFLMGANRNVRGGESRINVRDNSPRQERNEFLLAMLFAFPKFEFEAPPLPPEVGGDRRVAVRSMVGPGDAFLLRVGVIEGDDIDVQRHVAILQWCDQALCPLDEIDRAVVRHDPNRSASASNRCRSVSAEGTTESPSEA